MKKTILIFICTITLILSSISVHAANRAVGIINNYPYTGTYYALPVNDYAIGGVAEVTNQVAQVGSFTARVQGASYIFSAQYNKYIQAGTYDGSNTAALSNYVFVATTNNSNAYVYVEGNCIVNGGMVFPNVRTYK